MNLRTDTGNITHALACAIEDRKIAHGFWSVGPDDTNYTTPRSEAIAADALETAEVFRALMRDIASGDLIIVRRADIQRTASLVAYTDGIDTEVR